VGSYPKVAACCLWPEGRSLSRKARLGTGTDGEPSGFHQYGPSLPGELPLWKGSVGESLLLSPWRQLGVALEKPVEEGETDDVVRGELS
jgi:hypothetical protein